MLLAFKDTIITDNTEPTTVKKGKTIYRCRSCGYDSLKWLGKCPECGEWDAFAEETKTGKADSLKISSVTVTSITDVEENDDQRVLTGIGEFDRVLGGGIVPGSLVLIGGDPGIGKSTLMLQALCGLASGGGRVLYVSGEESARQIRMRGSRLGAGREGILLVSEIDVDIILGVAEQEKPAVLVIDSIQTMYNSTVPSAPGSITQVRESTMKLMIMAKKSGIPIFLIGHVTKDGAIAGPRLMEHMVDTVLYFEGDRNHVFRILRAVKNRFGSTNEIGVFEMGEKGLEEVPNPSAVFLSERPENAPGSSVTASMEGTRPVLVEVQGLASNTAYGTPRRTILGLDSNRVAMIVAVLEKRAGLNLMGHDIFMNVAGGVKVDEPSTDLSIAAAAASSFLDRPIPQGTVVIGEIGLTGEIRAVSHIDQRISEAKKMGFTKCIVPMSNAKRTVQANGIEVVGVSNLSEALTQIFS